MITFREYKKPATIEEAWQLNQKRTSKIIAGMLWTKMSKNNVMTAVDLVDLCLNTIEETETEFRLGCMVTLRQMELNESLDAYSNGAIRESLRHIVGVQFRNLATVGGSVYGRFGFSDVISMLMAMDTYVEMYKGGVIPLAQFVTMPYDRDLLVRIIIKKEKASFNYQSVRISRTDFPVLTCAAAMTESGVRMAMGARPAKAMLVADEENILTMPLTEEKAKAFAEYAAAHVPTSGNNRGSAAYRTHLVKVLAERAVMALAGKGGNA